MLTDAGPHPGQGLTSRTSLCRMSVRSPHLRAPQPRREQPRCRLQPGSMAELPCLGGTHKSDRVSPQELCWLSSAAKFPMTAEFPVGGLSQYGKRHDLHQTAGDSVRHVRLCCTWSCGFSWSPWPDFDFGRGHLLVVIHPVLKLTRFRGHPRICVEGVHDAKQGKEASTIPA